MTHKDETSPGLPDSVVLPRSIELELRKLTAAVEQNAASIVITDVDGTIEYVNPAFERQTGYTAEEAVGKNPRILNSGRTPSEVFPELWDTILAGKVWRGEFINSTKAGEEYFEEALIAPIRDESGTIVSFVAVKENVTRRKRAEEALRRSEGELREANRALNKFFSIIAHDLRSPFNALLNLTEILKETPRNLDEESYRSVVDGLHESATTTFALLENLLLWAQSQSGRMPVRAQAVDLRTVAISEAAFAEVAARRKDIAVRVEIVNPVPAYVDPAMTATIVRNLVSNAVKFTPHGGAVTISGGHDVAAGVSFLEVADTGVGIDDAAIDDLFRIDVSRSTRGTDQESGSGLGLVLCKEFARTNGGNIRARSTVGVGSVFRVDLPARG